MSVPPTEMVDSFTQLGGIYLGIDQQFQAISYKPAMEQTEQDLAAEHAERWPRAVSPDGTPWPALAESTVKRKGHSRILVDTTLLSESVINPEHPQHVREVLDTGLTFGTAVPYGIFHQQGGPKLPRREFLGMNEESVDQVANRVADHAVANLLGRIGHAAPRLPRL